MIVVFVVVVVVVDDWWEGGNGILALVDAWFDLEDNEDILSPAFSSKSRI